METGKEKITFGERLRELRIAKGWSQYLLAARSGCTNSNISYLESHLTQRPRVETVVALAAALDWPVNEARRLAGYSESEDNLTPLETEEDFRLALYGYKSLSGPGRALAKKQISEIIDFAVECERNALEQGAGNDGNVPEMTLDQFNERVSAGSKVKT